MSLIFSRRALVAWLCCIAAVPAAVAQVSSYPNRPIRLIVPYAAGGGTDQLGRLIAEKLRQRLGQAVVVDNKPGAGTIVGTDLAAKQPGDGYTLLLTTSALSSAPAMIARLPFDPVKDFTPIANVGVMLISMSANNRLPAANVKELISYMKAHPDKVNYGSYGIATTANISMALFNQRAGVTSTHIPYKGGASQALPEMVGGELDIMFDAMASSAPLVKAGKIKVLAVASSKRSSLMPDVPTVAEAANLPGFAFEPWYGIVGPAGMPREVVERLNREINAAVAEPEVQESLRNQYISPLTGAPAMMRDIIVNDIAYWSSAAKAAGVKPE
ncbi:MAG: tripartite tricarboxylate transporter substrate binding protein [Ramlibacter sp.]|nr:tripartite tricarboxylate transporter substrate binding protein [Ramlibacter sp.]